MNVASEHPQVHVDEGRLDELPPDAGLLEFAGRPEVGRIGSETDPNHNNGAQSSLVEGSRGKREAAMAAETKIKNYYKPRVQKARVKNIEDEPAVYTELENSGIVRNSQESMRKAPELDTAYSLIDLDGEIVDSPIRSTDPNQGQQLPFNIDLPSPIGTNRRTLDQSDLMSEMANSSTSSLPYDPTLLNCLGPNYLESARRYQNTLASQIDRNIDEIASDTASNSSYKSFPDIDFQDRDHSESEDGKESPTKDPNMEVASLRVELNKAMLASHKDQVKLKDDMSKMGKEMTTLSSDMHMMMKLMKDLTMSNQANTRTKPMGTTRQNLPDMEPPPMEKLINIPSPPRIENREPMRKQRPQPPPYESPIFATSAPRATRDHQSEASEDRGVELLENLNRAIVQMGQAYSKQEREVIKEYSDLNNDFIEWVEEFELAAYSNAWPQDQWGKIFVNKLSGQAQFERKTYLRGLIEQGIIDEQGNGRISYTRAREYFTERFTRQNPELHAAEQIRKLKFKPKDSIIDYVDKFKKYYRRINEEPSLATLISGIQDRDLKIKLREDYQDGKLHFGNLIKRVQNLQEILFETCKTCGSYSDEGEYCNDCYRAFKNKEREESKYRDNRSNSPHPRARSQERVPIDKAAGGTRPKSVGFQGNCYRCGEFGHSIRDCKQNPAKELAKKMNRVESSEVLFRGDKRKITCEVQIKDQVIEALLDTGCTVSCITENIVHRLGLETFKIKPICLNGVNASVWINSAVFIPILIGNENHQKGGPITALVIQGVGDELLLGMDFLKIFNIILEPSTNLAYYEIDGGKMIISKRGSTTTSAWKCNVEEIDMKMADGMELDHDDLTKTIERKKGNDVVTVKAMESITIKPGHCYYTNVKYSKNKLPYNYEIKVSKHYNGLISLPNNTADSRISNYLLTYNKTKNIHYIKKGSTIAYLDGGKVLEPEQISTGYNINENLSENNKTKLTDFLDRNRDLFAESIHDIKTPAKVKPIRFKMKNNSPVNLGYYRRSQKEQEIINEQIKEMLETGIIVENSGEYAAPCFCVDKKGGKKRLVVDFRGMNDRTEGFSFPIPNIEDSLDKLNGSQYFCKIDLFSGFNQIPIHPKDQPKTGFVTPEGTYQFTRLPFGLRNASNWFQHRISKVLQSELNHSCLVYIDDIIIFGKTFAEMLQKLKKVMSKLREANFKMNRSKCSFGETRLEYLGHIVSKAGIEPNPEKIDSILQIPAPTSKREVQSFLGMVGYYRKFIENYSKIVFPILETIKGVFTDGEMRRRKIQYDERCLKNPTKI